MPTVSHVSHPVINHNPKPVPDPLTAGSWYLRLGWRVFPIMPAEGDKCACGLPDCASPGKHPVGHLVPRGFHDATDDPAVLAQWCALYPDLNIGIATGAVSGIFVLDIDPDHGGLESLSELEGRYGRMEHPTWAVMTGGGGLHLYFRHPGNPVPNSAGKLGPGLDVRGDGGYVLAPPSNHISGESYRWDAGGHPRTAQLRPAPPWLLARCQAARPEGNGRAPTLPDRVKDGERNNTLTSIAGTMRRRGFSEDAIVAALLIENKQRCNPPLPEHEVSAIATSVGRYAPEAV